MRSLHGRETPMLSSRHDQGKREVLEDWIDVTKFWNSQVVN
jgi:hypothetical protein